MKELKVDSDGLGSLGVLGIWELMSLVKFTNELYNQQSGLTIVNGDVPLLMPFCKGMQRC